MDATLIAIIVLVFGLALGYFLGHRLGSAPVKDWQARHGESEARAKELDEKFRQAIVDLENASVRAERADTLDGELRDARRQHEAAMEELRRSHGALSAELATLKEKTANFDEQKRLLIEAREDDADLHMVCGKGGYVRAIARDLGRELGCLGHVATLRRVWSGPFEVADAVPFDLIDRDNQAEIETRLLPIQSALAELPELRATEQGAIRIRNGNPGQVLGTAQFGETVWVSHAGQALCIGRYLGGEVQPDRVFNL